MQSSSCERSIRLSEKTVFLLSSSPSERFAGSFRWLAVICLLLSLVWVPSTRAGCVETGLAVTGEPSPPPGIGGMLRAIMADGDHLMVVVQVPEAIHGTLSLVDPQGGVLAEEVVQLDPYEIGDVLMVDALVEVPARGFQFSLRLEDSASGAPVVLAEVPVHIGLDCTGVDQCSLVAKPGFATPGALAEPALIPALEEVKAAGSSDMLGDVLAEYPELTGSVVQLVLALGQADSGGGLSVRPDPDPCTCRWVPTGDVSAPSIQTVTSIQKELVTDWTHGVAGYVAGQTIDGVLTANFPAAFANLGMHLVCSKTLGYQSIASLLINGRPVPSFEIPSWSPCESDCVGQIEHDASSEVCTEAKVFGGGGQTAEADLKLESEFLIDEVVQYAINSWTDLFVEPTGTDQQLVQARKRKTTTLTSKSSVGKLTLDGSFMASASRAGDGPGGSYTFAAASAGFTQWITGKGDCAADDWAYYAFGDSGGGEVLVRWGDPP